ALQRGGQRRGALGGEVEITTWRTFVAPRRAHVFPMRREVAERFELVERGVDGAGREPGRIHDVEAEAVSVGDGVKDGDLAKCERRRRFSHGYLYHQPMLVSKIDGSAADEVPAMT